MPSLKDYRDRIASVKSTKKITSAMKLVAASKLKKAQEKAEAAQPYAQRMNQIVGRLLGGIKISDASPKLLAGTGKDNIYLLVVVTSDRGLAGGFNSNVIRLARQKIVDLEARGKVVKIITIGRKGRDALKRTHKHAMVEHFEGPGRSDLSFYDADKVAKLVLGMLDREEFDICTLIFNKFRSVIAQVPTEKQMIPMQAEIAENDNEPETTGATAVYTFEPEEEALLGDLLPKNFSTQIFGALLDSSAGEQAARMTAMDNATRNAGDRIDQLTLQYNRARQAAITTELIEIISGAEAL